MLLVKYFKDIDTIEKAYFLGLLYADGNVYQKRNRTQISLLNGDRYILEEMKKEFGSPNKLYMDRGKYCKLVVDNKDFTNNLISQGCIPRKSTLIRFPSLREDLMSHFIRGYFDGDGCVWRTQVKKGYHTSFCSNEIFLGELKQYLISKLGIKISKFRRRRENKDSGDIMIYEREDNPVLFHYLYEGCKGLFLLRKFKKFRNGDCKWS